MQRRSFIKQLGGLAALAGLPISNTKASDLRIAVVGGGVAGSRTAAYAKLAMPDAKIHLFAPEYAQSERRVYAAVQAGYRPLTQMKLQSMGVHTSAESVTRVDPLNCALTLANNRQYHADVLVMAPGIDFRNEQDPTSLHAWQHHGDDVLLWQKIQAMDNGDNVVISVPPMPYRYPRGPYQRANRIATYLSRYKPASKVIILDSNNVLPQGASLQASVERLVVTDDTVKYLDTRSVSLAGETLRLGVANIIPAQQAGKLAVATGLASAGGWCQVNHATLESSCYRNVFVVGDANDAALFNKTAVTADAQAARCAVSIQALKA